MPNQTLEPKQDDKLNPAAQQEANLTDFDKINQRAQGGMDTASGAAKRQSDNQAFRDKLANQEMQATMARGKANDLDGIRKLEGNPIPSNFDTTLGGDQGKSGGGRSFLRNAKQRWLVGSLVGLMLSAFVAMAQIPQAFLIFLKEIASSWIDKNGWNSNSRRMKKIAKKAFQADANCKSGVACRYKQGVFDDELKRMREKGLNPEVEKVGDFNRIKSFGSVDANGNNIRVGVDDFERAYSNNFNFRASYDSFFDPRDGLNRGADTRKVYSIFGVKRQKFSDTNDPKKAEQEFRRTIYGGDGQDINTRTGDCPGQSSGSCQETPEEKQSRESLQRQLGDAYSEIQNGAAKVRADLEASNYERPPSVTPNMSFMDFEPSRLTGTLEKTVKGALGAAVKGVYAIAEKACAVLQFIRTISIGAKIFMMFGLIAYALIFLTEADSLKAGDGNFTTLAFLMGLFLRPSVEEGSRGKTFFDSPFLGLVTEGKVNDRAALGRYTAGTPPLRLFTELQSITGRSSVSTQTCRQINSWYGQLFGIITGVATLIFTGGTLNAAAVAGSVATQVLLSVLSSYMIPLMIQFVAGTVAPDPEDPQGGFGLGMALLTGLALFRHQRSKANGDRPLLQSERATVEREANQEIGFATKAANLGKNPFSIDEPNSITSRLAVMAAPFVLAPTSNSNYQNLATTITSPFSMVGSSLSKLLTPAVGAQASQDGYGSEFCTDVYNQDLKLAVDATCAPLDGEEASKLEGRKYDPEIVRDYMLLKQHIDPDTGEPKSEEYKSYIADCFEGVVPITPDGRGVDINEDVDTQKCLWRDTYNDFDKDPNAANPADRPNYEGDGVMADMFRLWRKDSGIGGQQKEEVDGVLGVGEEAADSGSGATGPLNPGAFTWPIAPSSVSTITSCMNRTDPSYRIHSGLDIAAPLGTNIVAVADGQVVVESKSSTGFEYYIAIKHANGSITGYGHNQENLVSQGDTVKQGQPIARVGSRGQSTGPHLHMNYIPSGNSPYTSDSNSFNPLFDNLMPKPADAKDQAGCLSPSKLKPR